MLKWEGLQSIGEEISLKSLSWNCVVNHCHCTLSSRQMYENTGQTPVEAVYTFALPREAVVTSFAIECDDRKLTAQIMSVEQAAESYEDAVDSGDMPVLLEYSQDGLCTVNIGSLKPREKIVVCITCDWLLKVVAGTVRVTIPTMVGERYSRDGRQGNLLPHQYVEHSLLCEYPVTAHFEFLSDWYDSANFSIPGFSPRCTFSREKVTLDIAEGYANRDLTVVVTGVSPCALSYLLADRDQYRAISVLPVPKLSDASPRKALSLSLVVDCSGSMTGAAIEEARRALTVLPELLTEEDKLTLTLFGSEAISLFRKPHACTRSFFRRDFIPRISEINSDLGGTEMAAALAQAATYADESSDVLLITDGEIWDTEECIELAKRNGQRIFVIGIGMAPNDDFCHKIAAATQGSAEIVLPSEDMTAATARMIERMRLPVLQVRDFVPKHSLTREMVMPSVRSDETLTTFYRFAKLPGAVPSLELSNGVDTLTVTGSPWKLIDNQSLLMIAANQELRDRVDGSQEFALRYSLLSKETSLYLVNERETEEKVRQPVKLQRIPQMQKEFEYFACSRPTNITSMHSSFSAPTVQGPSNGSYIEWHLDGTEKSIDTDRIKANLSEEFLQAVGKLWNFEAVPSEAVRDALIEIADELELPVEFIFFHYLLWDAEKRTVVLTDELLEFKDQQHGYMGIAEILRRIFSSWKSRIP